MDLLLTTSSDTDIRGNTLCADRQIVRGLNQSINGDCSAAVVTEADRLATGVEAPLLRMSVPVERRRARRIRHPGVEATIRMNEKNGTAVVKLEHYATRIRHRLDVLDSHRSMLTGIR